jgi:hypothetical protein
MESRQRCNNSFLIHRLRIHYAYHKRCQLLNRLEVRRLKGVYVLDPSSKFPVLYICIAMQLDDKSTITR